MEEDSGVEMLAGASAWIGPGERAGIFPNMVYELGQRIDRKAGVNDQGRRRPDGGADRHEAFLAPAKLRVHARVGHGSWTEERPGVTVRFGARNLVPGQVAVRARLRFHDNRLAPDFGQLI